jgi:hypothetical protein
MLHNRKTGSWVLLGLTLLFLLRAAECNLIDMSVSSNNLQINQLGNYTFTINRQFDPVNFAVTLVPTPVPLNSTIAITFPSQFRTISSTSTPVCTDTSGNDLGCTLNSATRKVTVSRVYTNSSNLGNATIIIIMLNIVGAFKAGPTGNFFWEILYPNGSTIEQGPDTTTNAVSTSLNFNPGTFQCTSKQI